MIYGVGTASFPCLMHNSDKIEVMCLNVLSDFVFCVAIEQHLTVIAPIDYNHNFKAPIFFILHSVQAVDLHAAHTDTACASV